MNTFTPGPWFVEDGMPDVVMDAEGGVIAEHVHGLDAHLISAAPDLLDALKLAQLHINGGPGIQSGVEWWAMYDQINAAIAIATREAL